MNIRDIFINLILVLVLLSGCSEQKTENIDMSNDQAGAVMGLDYRDFDKAASSMIQSLVGSGTLKRADGRKNVVTTARIVNDTMQRIDTDQLMAKVEQELINSGMVVMTSAVGGEGAKDDMVYDIRDVRDSEAAKEFKKETLPELGNLLSPDMSISGKILQRNIRLDKKTQQVEYYFQLRLTNLKDGTRIWQEETILGKRGSNKSVSW